MLPFFKKKMKSVIIIIFLIANIWIIGNLAVNADEVETTILDEGFESGIPAAWDNTGWLDSYNAVDAAHNGSHWAYSWSAGDTLTISSLEFGTNTTLTFWYRAESNLHPMDLIVYIDESNAENIIWSDIGFTHTSYEQSIINLDNFTGTHQIIFRSNTSDTYGQLLDDIRIISYFEADNGDGSPNDEGNGDNGEIPAENIGPVADLSNGEPYHGYTNGSIFFDGTLSYDSDGTIVKWFWDFGDGSTKTGETVYNSYESPGEYNVTLHVVDDDNEEGIDTTMAIVQYGNVKPSDPIVKIKMLLPQFNNIYIVKNQNNKVEFLVSAHDSDSEQISFVINWGDGNDEIISQIENDEVLQLNHTWNSSGLYKLSFITKDDAGLFSDETKIILFLNINSVLIDDKITGYLIDYENNGSYSHYYNVETGKETIVTINEKGEYQIDANDDQSWDYIYNETNGLSVYQSEKPANPDSTTNNTPGLACWMILLSIVFIIFLQRKK